jgi:hypothetical protein
LVIASILTALTVIHLVDLLKRFDSIVASLHALIMSGPNAAQTV